MQDDEDFDDLMETESEDELYPSEFQGTFTDAHIRSWQRPPLQAIDEKTDSIIFQQFEIDYTMVQPSFIFKRNDKTKQLIS
jgi:hypothetical protein